MGKNMKVMAVDPQSLLFGYIRPGYTIKSVNGQAVLDTIDFQFKTADDRVTIVFADKNGSETVFTFDGDYPGDLGLTLDDDRVIVCKNNCVFCFVHQQPKGMRRALYVKDEDYRLSFTHGNFVTLSHTSENDVERIIAQRLSPLYVSVHATDDAVRRKMLGSRTASPILPRLKRLCENGITIHTQCVLCPGINDGEYLTRTIDDLAGLSPMVSSLAVVPVGLTKYRKNLPKLRKYTADEAASIIDYVESRQKEFLRKSGSRFVWLADEFYVETDRPFPKRVEYEDLPQFENGVGMAREFMTVFNRRRAGLRGMKSRRKALLLTGHSAYPMFESQVLPYVRQKLRLRADVLPVDNKFWGSMVTVSGLLTGKDLARAARSEAAKYDVVVLPPNCINQDGLFLDDMSLEDYRVRVGKEVIVGKYDLAETLKEVFV
jgi:putative radical SAM enzyme (TIGR03279 family)